MGFAVGIAGISRSGKSTMANRLAAELDCPVIGIDSYQIGTIRKTKENGEEWEDWEDPAGHDLERFYQDLLRLKQGDGVVVAEGFLLYHDPRIVQALDLKLHLDLPKEVAKARRAATKNLTPNFEEYYEHIWSAYFEYNDLSSPNIHFIDATASSEEVFARVTALYRQHSAYANS